MSLVSQPDGARVFTTVQDLTTLTEIASSQPLVLDTLLLAWLNAMAATADKNSLRSKIDSAVGSLVASFKGTDAVTLLAFLASLLPHLEPDVGPPPPNPTISSNALIQYRRPSRKIPNGYRPWGNTSAILQPAVQQLPAVLHSPTSPLLFSRFTPSKLPSCSSPSEARNPRTPSLTSSSTYFWSTSAPHSQPS